MIIWQMQRPVFASMTTTMVAQFFANDKRNNLLVIASIEFTVTPFRMEVCPFINRMPDDLNYRKGRVHPLMRSVQIYTDRSLCRQAQPIFNLL